MVARLQWCMARWRLLVLILVFGVLIAACSSEEAAVVEPELNAESEESTVDRDGPLVSAEEFDSIDPRQCK